MQEVQTWLADFEQLATIAAKAAAARERLFHERKVVLAELMAEAEKLSPSKYKTCAAQEVYARTHERYKACLQDYEQAIYTDEKARLAVTKRRWEFDAWRTETSFSKEQIGRYSSVS